MEIGEQVAVGGLPEELEIECPFKEDGPLDVMEEGESIANDDIATDEQANNAGALGTNLTFGKQGRKRTVEGPCPPPAEPPLRPRLDTPRTGAKVFVPGADGIEDQEFPFVVAAHHCIPGEASLAPSDLKDLMTKTKEGTVFVGGKQRTIKNHVGYNVNGAHNGVWLPGNYAIRAANKPLEKLWSKLESKANWCMNYVAAVSARAGGQFHDSHEEYSEAVKKLLNKIHEVVTLHECHLCEEKTEVPPPYPVKLRLYALSEYFRSQLNGSPRKWRQPWFSSDRWRGVVFGGNRKARAQFLRTFRNAKRR
jgi:hypothetical protein